MPDLMCFFLTPFKIRWDCVLVVSPGLAPSPPLMQVPAFGSGMGIRSRLSKPRESSLSFRLFWLIGFKIRGDRILTRHRRRLPKDNAAIEERTE